MKKYLKPELDILELDVLDVIQTSGGLEEGGDGDDSDFGDNDLEITSLNTNYFDKQ